MYRIKVEELGVSCSDRSRGVHLGSLKTSDFLVNGTTKTRGNKVSVCNKEDSYQRSGVGKE